MNASFEVPAYRPRLLRASRNARAFSGCEECNQTIRGWLMYDAACPFCTRAAKNIRPIVHRRAIFVLPLQTSWAQKLLAERGEPLLRDVRFLRGDGILFAGGDALVEVARQVWAPLGWIAHLPGIHFLVRRAYNLATSRRHRSKRRAFTSLAHWAAR